MLTQAAEEIAQHWEIYAWRRFQKGPKLPWYLWEDLCDQTHDAGLSEEDTLAVVARTKAQLKAHSAAFRRLKTRLRRLLGADAFCTPSENPLAVGVAGPFSIAEAQALLTAKASDLYTRIGVGWEPDDHPNAKDGEGRSVLQLEVLLPAQDCPEAIRYSSEVQQFVLEWSTKAVTAIVQA